MFKAKKRKEKKKSTGGRIRSNSPPRERLLPEGQHLWQGLLALRDPSLTQSLILADQHRRAKTVWFKSPFTSSCVKTQHAHNNTQASWQTDWLTDTSELTMWGVWETITHWGSPVTTNFRYRIQRNNLHAQETKHQKKDTQRTRHFVSLILSHTYETVHMKN